MNKWFVGRTNHHQWWMQKDYSWMALKVGKEVAFFHSWRQAYEYADKQARQLRKADDE